MVDASVSALDLGEDLTAKWQKLKAKISTKNNGRNELAHFQINPDVFYEKEGLHPPSDRKPTLVPYFSISDYVAQSRISNNGEIFPIEIEKELKPSDIQGRGKSFAELANKINYFNGGFHVVVEKKLKSKA